MADRSRSAELAALTTIAAQVNCTQDLDEILSNALETTLDVVGESAGAVFLVDEDTRQLVLSTHRGVSAAFVASEATVGRSECLCGLALQSTEPLIVIDMALHPVRSRTACVQEGFHSCIRLPLLARGEVLGLLNIQSRNERDFGPDEELLTAIGNQIGIAIANAQLIEDAEQRRATLDSVMNSLVDGLILIDSRGRIVYVNPCAEDILGLSSPTLLGATLDGMKSALAGHTAGVDEMADQLRAAADDAHSTPTLELSLTQPQQRTLQAQFFPINDKGGGHLGLGLLLRDITRERELDEMKSQLLSTVSHELRTPLASIKGFATTLLRDDVTWDEEARREFLSIIDKESDRLAELISNLLDMSRVEAGTLRVEPEPIDLAPIVEDTASEFQRMTRQHQIEVHLPAELPLASADPRRTRQVLRNLVENAVKYSPNGGKIAVSVEEEESWLEVSVSDEGIGIEPKVLDRIFDRFYQVDSASTRKVGGSGLGLSICKAIVDAHGGDMWVDSAEGVGSTFYFSLPVIGV